MTQVTDYLIVGQGIAGTALAHFLLEAGASVCVVETHLPNTSSRAAAGIMNPVTGRRFVKTWLLETLFPFAKTTYKNLENRLGERFLYERNILRSYQKSDENELCFRFSQPDYEGLIRLHQQTDDDDSSCLQSNNHHYCEIMQAAQLDVPRLLDAFQHFLKNKNLFDESLFKYEDIRCLEDNHILYKNNIYKKVIFCEGQWVKFNPYFKDLPFVMTKGEALVVELSPKLRFDKILKHQHYLAPLPNGGYWVGATNQWQPNDVSPSLEAKLELTKYLDNLLSNNYKIKKQESAIRPTVRDRRPLIGLHPEKPQFGIFNGLGTKGVSLAPFWAWSFANHLQHGEPLAAEVNIARFRK